MSEVVRVRVSAQSKAQIEKAIQTCIELNPKISTKGEALNQISKYYLSSKKEAESILEPEVIRKEEIGLEKICPLGVLRKLIDPKDQVKKWYCLRGISQTKKGKPQLVADGRDIESIKQFCSSCQIRTQQDEQLKRTYEQILAIKRFGESQIETNLHTCIHPELKFMQILLGDKGELICNLRKKRVNINKVCIPTECEYFTTTKVTFKIKETKAYQNLRKQLEHKQPKEEKEG